MVYNANNEFVENKECFPLKYDSDVSASYFILPDFDDIKEGEKSPMNNYSLRRRDKSKEFLYEQYA
jgi:hypothetical protein